MSSSCLAISSALPPSSGFVFLPLVGMPGTNRRTPPHVERTGRSPVQQGRQHVGVNHGRLNSTNQPAIRHRITFGQGIRLPLVFHSDSLQSTVPEYTTQKLIPYLVPHDVQSCRYCLRARELHGFPVVDGVCRDEEGEQAVVAPPHLNARPQQQTRAKRFGQGTP